MPSPVEDRDLDPNDHSDQDALMAQNRAYLEWEIDLINILAGDPAAPYMERKKVRQTDSA